MLWDAWIMMNWPIIMIPTADSRVCEAQGRNFSSINIHQICQWWWWQDWKLSLMCASNIWCPTLPPGIPGVNSLMSMLFPGRNLLTCALPRVGKRNFCILVVGIGHTGDIPSHPGVGVGNQICEAHIIVCTFVVPERKYSQDEYNKNCIHFTVTMV